MTLAGVRRNVRRYESMIDALNTSDGLDLAVSGSARNAVRNQNGRVVFSDCGHVVFRLQN